jgi:hypothetical protein
VITRPGCGRCGCRHVGVVEHDEGVGATKFEYRLLRGTASRRTDRRASAVRAGQRHCSGAVVGNEPVDRGGHLGFSNDQRRHQALGQPRIDEQLLQRQRAPGHVRGVLEQDAVACGD